MEPHITTAGCRHANMQSHSKMPPMGTLALRHAGCTGQPSSLAAAFWTQAAMWHPCALPVPLRASCRMHSTALLSPGLYHRETPDQDPSPASKHALTQDWHSQPAKGCMLDVWPPDLHWQVRVTPCADVSESHLGSSLAEGSGSSTSQHLPCSLQLLWALACSAMTPSKGAIRTGMVIPTWMRGHHILLHMLFHRYSAC